MQYWPLKWHPFYWDLCCRKSNVMLLQSCKPIPPTQLYSIKVWFSCLGHNSHPAVELNTAKGSTNPARETAENQQNAASFPSKPWKKIRISIWYDIPKTTCPASFSPKPAMQSEFQPKHRAVWSKTHFIPMNRPLVHTNNVPAGLFESKNPAEDKTFSIKLNFLI